MTPEKFRIHADNCRRKVRFKSPASARDFARQATSRLEKKFKVYLCPCCERWHIATKKGK